MTETTPSTPAPDLAAQVAQLSADLSAANTALAAAQARADAAEASAKAVQLSARKAAVASLFSTLGREPTDEAIAPYLEMPEASFAAVSADLARAVPAAPGHLFSAQGNGGADAGSDPVSIAAKATQFKAAQAALGVTISDGQAVAHVLKGA